VTCGAAFRGFAGVYGSLHNIVVAYSADCCGSVAAAYGFGTPLTFKAPVPKLIYLR